MWHNAYMEGFNKHIYRVLLVAAVGMIALGTVFYHFIEGWRWLDSYYFSVVTLATVGYGDFTPKTDIGKLFTTFYILSGVGIITAFISISLRKRGQRWSKNQDKS